MFLDAAKTVLTLNERREAIKWIDSEPSALAVTFNIGKTQVTNLLERKAEVK